MLGFLQLLRHPLQYRRTRSQSTKSTLSKVDSSTSNENRGRRSPLPPLPNIKDRGPYQSNRYANEHIYWNSVMVEAEEGEKTWLLPTVRQTQGAAKRPAVPNITETGLSKPINGQHATTSTSGIVKNGDAQVTSIRQKEHDDPTRSRADNDLIVMSYHGPSYSNLPKVPVARWTRSPGPLSPGTREWDDFMDYPYGESTHTNGIEHEEPHISPNRYPPVSGPLFAVEEEKQLPALPSKQNPYAQRQTALTWDPKLHQVLDQSNIHPALRMPVSERAMDCNISNSNEQKEQPVVSTAAADLVSSIDRPVTRGGSSDPLPTLINDVDYDASENERDDHASLIVNCSPSSHDQYFTSPPTSSDPSSQPNGIPSSRLSSDSTSSTSIDSLYRNPSPRGSKPLYSRPTPESFAPPSRIQSLLRTVLTPSEISLFNTTRVHTPPALGYHPPLSPSDSNFHFAFPRPLQARLTSKCHTLIHHLQDRVSYLEDKLIPTMGERLENKSFTIDVLGLEVQRLDDQIAEMRTTVDYATRILAGCWLRDYEMWRTLAGIREERRTRGPGGLLRRLTGRKSKIADGVLSPVQRGQQQQLSKRELDAVMVMAEQNVRILHEDVDEMDERVGGMKSALGGFPVVEVEEGSWRDI